MKNTRTINVTKFVVSIVVCQCAGIIGSVFTTPAIPTWYATLQKPAFTPPNWLFAPAWITLYLLMGIAAFLIWRVGLENKRVRMALIIFLVQLVLNSLWSVAFFGMQSPLYGFIVIIILWLAILLTILLFARISAVAAWLLVPYILWVSFASALNISIWQLNP
jgi:benzodiazapine receptor